MSWWFRSAVASKFESMFDGSLPEISDLSSLSDAALVDAIGGVTRAENAACAVKVAAMAELFCRRTGLTNAEDRDSWWVDPEAAVAAEIGAAGGISQGLALSQTHRGVALRDRLPKVAALFAAGVISDLLVRTIVWRTALVLSPEAMAELDLELAQRVTRWGALSVKKTEQAIDELVEGIDPGALRRGRASGTAHGVQFGSPADEPGFITMWARLYATDGVVIEQRVEEMARSVCDADPRDADERRADALTAAVSHTAMACECGQPDCPALRTKGPRRTPWCMSSPTRNPCEPLPPRLLRQRRVSQRPRPRSAQRRRRSCSAAGCYRRPCWAQSWSVRRSVRSATPAARHRNRVTHRRCRRPTLCAAGI